MGVVEEISGTNVTVKLVPRIDFAEAIKKKGAGDKNKKQFR